jgi:hypothetical protein
MQPTPEVSRSADPEARAARAELLDLLFGFVSTQALYACVRLGVPDMVGDQPVEVSDLAARCSADRPSLYRLLRYLASIGVFAEVAPGRFTGTRLSACLRTDSPGSLRHLALMNGTEVYRAWAEALYSVQTGKPAFERVFGLPRFAYLLENPEAAEIFNQAMAGVAAAFRTVPLLAYDWRDVRTVADIGGGNGALLTGLLAAHSHLRGFVIDLAHAADQARSVITAAGLAHRCEFIAADFFTDSLPAADVYLLCGVVHNWDDAKSAAILSNCRRFLPDNGRLLLIETVVPEGPEPSFIKLFDLQMLVIPGGKERTESEFRALLKDSGLDLRRVVPADAGISLFEAGPDKRFQEGEQVVAGP